MESKLSTAIVLPSFSRLPPEIRLMIYRLLLVSDRTLRMQWPTEAHLICPPNGLFPAILSTCHLIYGEALDVLYRENVFRAHRVNETNKMAALITHAKFQIGISCIEGGEIDASGLANFLGTHPNLRLLELRFKYDLLEDSKIRDILTNALFTSSYSSALTVLSDFKSERSSFNKARLVQTVETVVSIQKCRDPLRNGG